MIPHFCKGLDQNDIISNYDWSNDLNTASTQKFMETLNLPKVHPHCTNATLFHAHQSGEPLPLTTLHEEHLYERTMSTMGRLTTLWYQATPALLAMGELWLRLFAFVIGPLVICYLLTREMSLFQMRGSKAKAQKKSTEIKLFIIIFLGMSASTVLLTDSMYVYIHGFHNGFILFTIMNILAVRTSLRFNHWKERTLGFILLITSLACYLILQSEGTPPSESMPHGDVGIDLPAIQEGLYYSKENTLMSKVAHLWPEESRTYNIENGATPYLLTGDSLTGIPFLTNSSPEQTYHRVWVENDVDYEAVALDIAFPPDGEHSLEKPVILILHGLNGGSHEEYVREMVVRRTAEGHTCIVMIARGLMDTPVLGWNVFHGARTLDLAESAKQIRKALAPNQMLTGVGYSMGAIIISNYVARSGMDCQLDAAMAISGGLDMRENLTYKRSIRLWQPLLAEGLRDDFLVKKFDVPFRQRLTNEQHLALMRATSVSEIDVHAIVTYNGFNDLTHYYSTMSAMGDTNVFQSKLTNDTQVNLDVGRIGNVSIPMCVLHALDDPITTWRSMGHDPEALVHTGSGNLMMLLTKSGGHVGWPLGINPSVEGWRWMNDAARDFFNSVDQARKE